MVPTRRKPALRSRPPGRAPDLHSLSDRALLGLRLCDLGLRLRGSELEARAHGLHRELARRGLRLRPHVWLSTEWFAPDGVPGFAIPFYLAHPRLAALEQHYMEEVEGGSDESFRQMLRHEAGHALDAAHRLHDRPQWRELFGPFDAPYRRRYRPRPYSKRFVRHLKDWYAQSHPAEDFAETVAVWLDPDSAWRVRYRGWPAMRKLLYVNRLMREIAGLEPIVRNRKQVDPISTLSLTLGDYYEEKRRRYRLHLRHVYDRDLRRLFSPRKGDLDRIDAATYLRRASPAIREMVASRTGARRYAVDRVLREMIDRSSELDLVVRGHHPGASDRHLRRVSAHLSRYLAEGHDKLSR